MEGVKWGIFRKMDKDNPNLWTRKDLIRDGEGNLYKLLLSKDDEISLDEYERTASKFQSDTGLFPEKRITIYKYKVGASAGTQIIDIFSIISLIQGALHELKRECKTPLKKNITSEKEVIKTKINGATKKNKLALNIKKKNLAQKEVSSKIQKGKEANREATKIIV